MALLNCESGFGVALAIALSACGSAAHPALAAPPTALAPAVPPTGPAPSPAATPPALADLDALHCKELMAALLAGSPESAEKDFDDTLRARLPPPALATVWQSLQSQHGALSAWHVVKRDTVQAKDRFTLELQFARGVMAGLVVFEPEGKVAGLFFAEPPRQAPPSSEAPDPRVTELEITVGPLHLPGNLTLPKQLGTERLPGAVLIAGSGPNDRDETVDGLKPFRDLAFYLAAHGVASVRFDKRTRVHPEWFKPETSSVEYETIADSVAAFEVLRGRPEVDPLRLFVVGHSLGGLLAPEVATRAGGVAGLVLLAAPGRPVPVITLEQLRKRGATGATLSTLEAKVHSLPQLPANEVLLGVPAGYWQDLAKRDEMALAQKLGRPVLLLRGSEDQQVAAVDQDNWLRALTGRVPVQAATLPGLSHFFSAQPSSHVRDDVLERIVAFIEAPPHRP
jgi:alpha-beta hydrolase superfamily lysophospholipase